MDTTPRKSPEELVRPMFVVKTSARDSCTPPTCILHREGRVKQLKVGIKVALMEERIRQLDSNSAKKYATALARTLTSSPGRVRVLPRAALQTSLASRHYRSRPAFPAAV
jgi:hypothetical protein